MPNAGFFANWYLQLPSLALAAFIYLLLGRVILAPFLGADNWLMRVLAAVTDPVVRAIGAITPRIVPFPGIVLFAVVWLLSARILLHQLLLVRRMLG